MHSIDQNLIRAARCLGAGPTTVLRTVVIPGSLPYIFTGLQIGMGVAWFSLVAGEMIAGQFGLGYLINASYTTTRYPTIVIAMITLGLVGFASSAADPLRRQPVDGVSGAEHRVMTGGNLVLDAVGKEYRTAGAPVAAVQDFTLDIGAGELHVIVGPSGCGKSTLLGAVAGFTDITSGRIDLDGQAAVRPGPAHRRDRSRPGRRLPGQHALSVAYRRRQRRLRPGRAAAAQPPRRCGHRAWRACRRSGSGDIAHSYPGELSSGVQRRVEILRALVMEPAVLLLDEPFRGMDAISRSAMHDALLQIYDKFAVTVLFITHDIEEAVYLGSRVTVMTTRPGRVKTTIDIDLDRPRDRGIITAPHFRELVGEVSDAVRDEARRAFDVGEREMVR